MAIDKQVARYGPLKDFIAQGVRVGDTIHLSGQVSVDGTGATVAPNDIVGQVRQAYLNVAEVLGHFGATLDNVVSETWFVTDVPNLNRNARAVFTARAVAFGRPPDTAQTLIGVSALFQPDLMIEIQCVARI
jgi:2-iminobutanoate/2-iminopropanoate deaminase